MTTFGTVLKGLRAAAGWRQQDLAHELDQQVARSTLANIETGREPPSPRLWSLIQQHLPAWVNDLEPHYERARALVEEGRIAPRTRSVTETHHRRTLNNASGPHILGGPFVIERLHLIYTFRHSRAPEEIIEIRRVKATQPAHGYGLKFQHTDSDAFHIETEALWGGDIAVNQRHTTETPQGNSTLLLATFDFERRLRRGQTHEFALRHWTEHDPEPATEVLFANTLPTQHVDITVNFHGPNSPTHAWTFGPLADDTLVPKDHQSFHARPLPTRSKITTRFDQPAPGTTNGIAWTW